MNEYYTPDIREFFVGFKYQRRDGGEWYDCTFRGYDFSDVCTLLNRTNLRKKIEQAGSVEKFIETEKEYWHLRGLLFAVAKNHNLQKYLSQPTYDECIRAIKGQNDYNKNINEQGN